MTPEACNTDKCPTRRHHFYHNSFKLNWFCAKNKRLLLRFWVKSLDLRLCIATKIESIVFGLRPICPDFTETYSALKFTDRKICRWKNIHERRKKKKNSRDVENAGLWMQLTVFLHQNLLLAHVLHIHGAVDDELWGGAVVCHLLTLVALNLQSQPCNSWYFTISAVKLTCLQWSCTLSSVIQNVFRLFWPIILFRQQWHLKCFGF